DPAFSVTFRTPALQRGQIREVHAIENKPLEPMAAISLGSTAVVAGAQGRVGAVEELQLWYRRGGRYA
ncbi:MAG TPA: hypothetical protein VLM91_00310, partial [Candidatus Methylomirabilis sp.]|nr:hypothetical protein [Candidatus Methylomirabilis sp.]